MVPEEAKSGLRFQQVIPTILLAPANSAKKSFEVTQSPKPNLLSNLLHWVLLITHNCNYRIIAYFGAALLFIRILLLWFAFCNLFVLGAVLVLIVNELKKGLIFEQTRIFKIFFLRSRRKIKWQTYHKNKVGKYSKKSVFYKAIWFVRDAFSEAPSPWLWGFFISGLNVRESMHLIYFRAITR